VKRPLRGAPGPTPKRSLPPPPSRASRRRHVDPDEKAIAARIASGEDPEAFLCIDCACWMLEPAYCLCRERALW
jgi:hypothetical protein